MSMERTTAIDFEVLREPWNKYGLRDGSVIKGRYILTKIVKRELLRPDGTIERISGYNCEGQTITVVYSVPPGLKGQPSTASYSPQELEASIVQDDISYDTLAEEWNEYIAEDGTKIRLKFTMTRVARTSKFDKHGNPIYLVRSHGLGEVKPRKT